MQLFPAWWASGQVCHGRGMLSVAGVISNVWVKMGPSVGKVVVSDPGGSLWPTTADCSCQSTSNEANEPVYGGGTRLVSHRHSQSVNR